jgi:hypothetical protein
VGRARAFFEIGLSGSVGGHRVADGNWRGVKGISHRGSAGRVNFRDRGRIMAPDWGKNNAKHA